MSRTLRIAAFAVFSGAVGVYLGAPFFSARGDVKRRHLPGRTSDGHYQLELSCESCHTPFGGVDQKKCTGCHASELAAGNDSHPESKFTDPRNADRVAQLDATRCTTCHGEHEAARTTRGGVTQPRDFCGVCHGKIAEERPSHEGFTPDGCTSAGCHNFHDNRGLYEDFIAKHLAEPATLADARIAPPPVHPPAHQDLTCARCHDAGGEGFELRPTTDGCRTCHDKQAAMLDGGRHGMRHGAGLGPMAVAEARLPMRPEAAGKTLGCASCHDAHGADTRRAATDSCLGCHADDHSRAFPDSKHQAAGLSCATCHMPGGEHNQSATMRPSSKMGRAVCQSCHGLGFVLDALADEALVRRNFDGHPTVHVRTLEMVEERVANRKPKKELENR